MKVVALDGKKAGRRETPAREEMSLSSSDASACRGAAADRKCRHPPAPIARPTADPEVRAAPESQP